MEHCVFCSIIAGTIPAQIIEETDELIVFVSLENHPLIVPKKHIPDLFSLDEVTASYVAKESRRIATAMRDAMLCDGIYVTQANGAAAGQEVFHYHMHLYPKWEDGTALGRSEAERAELADKVRGALKA